VSDVLTPEQEARDLLERMWVDDAQDWSAGDVAELANILARLAEAERLLSESEALLCDPQGGAVANELAKRIQAHQMRGADSAPACPVHSEPGMSHKYAKCTCAAETASPDPAVR